MPAFDIYPRDDPVATLLWDDNQALHALTAMIEQGDTETIQKRAAGDSDSLSPGVIGAIAVVSLLMAVCMATAAILHRLWCMNPRCKACRILRCERWKPLKGL